MNGNPYQTTFIGALGEYPIQNYIDSNIINTSNYVFNTSNILESHSLISSNILQNQISITSNLIHRDPNNFNTIIRFSAQNPAYPLYDPNPAEMRFLNINDEYLTKIIQTGELFVYHPLAPTPAGYGAGWWSVEGTLRNTITETQAIRYDIAGIQGVTGTATINDATAAGAAVAGAAAGAAAATGITAAAGAVIATGDYGAVALGLAGGALFSTLGYLSYEAQVESNLSNNGFITEGTAVHSNISNAYLLLTDNISNICIAKGFTNCNIQKPQILSNLNITNNLTVSSGGNLGIRTTANFPLDVNGSVNIYTPSSYNSLSLGSYPYSITGSTYNTTGVSGLMISCKNSTTNNIITKPIIYAYVKDTGTTNINTVVELRAQGNANSSSGIYWGSYIRLDGSYAQNNFKGGSGGTISFWSQDAGGTYRPTMLMSTTSTVAGITSNTLIIYGNLETNNLTVNSGGIITYNGNNIDNVFLSQSGGTISGNLGIGTTPSYPLEVNGLVRLYTNSSGQAFRIEPYYPAGPITGSNIGGNTSFWLTHPSTTASKFLMGVVADAQNGLMNTVLQLRTEGEAMAGYKFGCFMELDSSWKTNSNKGMSGGTINYYFEDRYTNWIKTAYMSCYSSNFGDVRTTFYVNNTINAGVNLQENGINLSSKYLQLSGGTMSGALNINLTSGGQYIYLYNSSPITSGVITFANNTPDYGYIGMGGTNEGGNYANNLFIQADNALIFNSGFKQSGDTPRMIITAAGNVGINTTDYTTYNLNNNGSFNSTTIYRNGVELNNKYLQLTGGTLTGTLNVFDATGVNSATALRMFNIVGAQGRLVMWSSGTGVSSGFDFIWGPTTSATSYTQRWDINGGNSTLGDIFYIRNRSTTSLTTFVIYSNGNVGIGTTYSATYKLNVEGSLNATTIYRNGTEIDSTYLKITTASSTYLPLSGGNLTGLLNINGLQINGNNSTNTIYQSLANTDIGITQNSGNTTGGSINLTAYGSAGFIKFFTNGANVRMIINNTGDIITTGNFSSGPLTVNGATILTTTLNVSGATTLSADLITPKFNTSSVNNILCKTITVYPTASIGGTYNNGYWLIDIQDYCSQLGMAYFMLNIFAAGANSYWCGRVAIISSTNVSLYTDIYSNIYGFYLSNVGSRLSLVVCSSAGTSNGLLPLYYKIIG